VQVHHGTQAGVAQIGARLAVSEPTSQAVRVPFAHLIPGAQPALAAVCLVAGLLVERLEGLGPTIPLYVLAYIAGGTGSAVAAWKSLRRGRIDVNALMLLAAAGAAYLGEWSEGGILLFLFSLSNALEYYAMGRTRRAIRALLALRPQDALVRRQGIEIMVSVGALAVGDLVIVRPAERLAADGRVIHGRSSIDQSPITGESIPVDVAPGAPVFAGTINQRGSLEIEVTKPAEETVLTRIIALVEQAQAAQPPIQRVIDRVGQTYAVLIIVGAAAAYLTFRAFGTASDLAFYRAITLLVVASPCAVVIATPAAMLSAIANAARRGVLFKGGAPVEQLAGVRTVVFDKTGTLTTGRPVVTDVVAIGAPEDRVLSLAGALEQRSEHALADPVVQMCRERGLDMPLPETFEAVTGRGVRGRVGKHLVRVGSEEFMSDESVLIPEEAQAHLARLRRDGKTPILVGTDRVLGILAMADTIRPRALSALAALRALGIGRIVVLTGDHHEVAEVIARQLGIDDVRAGLLPEEKAEVVRQLAAQQPTAMIGDGVNDAPALATASVGIAMGAAGTDAAMETADVILMGDDLSRLPQAIALSREARRVVVQSLTFASIVIAVLFTVAFIYGIRLAFGVVGHEGSTVIVVLNGLRLLRFRSRA